MEAVVVEVAGEYAVVEVGLPAFCPGFQVVGFAPGGGDGAAFGAAVLVSESHRLALGRRIEAAGAAEVEDLAVAAEDDRDDGGFAGQPADLGGGEGFAAEDAAGAEVVAE